MNTPAHLIFGATALGRAGAPGRTAAAIGGSLAPDISLYLLAIWAFLIQGHEPQHIFGTLYFSETWQRIFAIDNSVFVWGAVLALGALVRRAWLRIFALAALFHIALDFPVHHDDGRPHFWPLSLWVFESPLSYWDPRHYGEQIGRVEAAACFICLALLWHRHTSVWARSVIGLALIAVLAPGLMWMMMF